MSSRVRLVTMIVLFLSPSAFMLLITACTGQFTALGVLPFCPTNDSAYLAADSVSSVCCPSKAIADSVAGSAFCRIDTLVTKSTIAGVSEKVVVATVVVQSGDTLPFVPGRTPGFYYRVREEDFLNTLLQAPRERERLK